MRAQSWDRRLYWCALGLYGVLVVAALAAGPTSWDEETDYLGIRTQIAHAVGLLRGAHPDYHDIHSDLEYYGTAGLFPAWLLWFGQQALLVGRLSLSQALFEPAAEHQLTGFYFVSHLVLAFEFVGLSLLTVSISRVLGARSPWIAGCLTLMLPSLLGHSFVNTKDIPFALFYTGYTYTLLRRQHSTEPRWWWCSLLASGLLINQKFVAIAPVLVSELLLWWLRSSPLRSFWQVIFFPIAALSFALLIQPAAWGLWPWVYLRESFDTFSRHGWGGCMWWGGTCIGVNQPGWSTLRYLWNWWSIKWPLLLVFLLFIQLLWFFKRLLLPSPSILWRSGWFLLLAQALLVPAMAVIRQSNLYDADRHTLFVYPALAAMAAFGFQRLCDSSAPSLLRSAMLILTTVLALVMVFDDLVLNPYQIAYLNEWGRYSHNHTTTALDYWSVSAKESLRQAQLDGSLSTSPTVDDSLGTLPLFIGYRQLAGHVSKGESPKLLFQIRDSPAFRDLDNCRKASEISRTLITGQKLVMSRLWTCP